MQNDPVRGKKHSKLSRLPRMSLVNRPEEPDYPYVNYLQCSLATSTEQYQNKRRNRPGQRMVVSGQFIDRFPNKPSRRSPHQRCILPFRRETNEKAVIYLTATSLFEKVKQEVDESGAERDTVLKMKQNSECGNQQKRSRNRETRLFREPLMLLSFRPLLAPFVPDLLRLLVNSVETYCYDHNWSLVYEPLPEYYDAGEKALIRLIAVWHDQKEMKKIIKRISVPVRIVAIRLFLDKLAIKPLLFKRKHVNELVKVPLFDFFLRPHPRVRAVVQRAITASSAVHVDTMAFMMIHLIHAWEYAQNPVEGKLQLASIYGHLLISFSEKPELRGMEYGEGKSIESALIEVVLEICDYHFWNHLTSLKIRAAFKNITDFERVQVAVENNLKRESVRQFLTTNEDLGLPDLYSERYSDSGFDFDDLPKLHSFCQRVSTTEDESSGKLSSPVLTSDSQSQSKDGADGTEVQP
ncbi:hypothetical protein FGIG_11167 [Fasciola gigantica]|uniref:Uncharacterized protein n=1 Tax=Fasciola gigantica TaxID=46835 RepID=A0A504Y7B1_FASGI|nr:hypothetical protein FGIG_11167 [Fasciola gigantica]